MTARSPSRRISLAAAAALAVAVPFCLEGLIVAANWRWYTGLVKPTFAPPGWLAAAFCAAIGCLLAWGLYRILRRPDYLPDRLGALRLVVIMLAFGLVWAWAFFASRHPSLGLGTAAATVVAAAVTMWRFTAVDRRAGLLMIPVVLATLFAAVVELSISFRN